MRTRRAVVLALLGLALPFVGTATAEHRPHAPRGTWLAGDFHVHTCYSHDVYCPRGDKGSYFEDPTGTPIDAVPLKDLPVWGAADAAGLGDYNTDIDQAYTMGGT